jgi:hypothetical protein
MSVEIMYKGKLGWQADELLDEHGGWIGIIAEFPDDSRAEICFGDPDLVVEPTQAEIDAAERAADPDFSRSELISMAAELVDLRFPEPDDNP